VKLSIFGGPLFFLHDERVGLSKGGLCMVALLYAPIGRKPNLVSLRRYLLSNAPTYPVARHTGWLHNLPKLIGPLEYFNTASSLIFYS
jgi:hypothetical protein